MGDAAASLVGPAIYREVVQPHERRLADAIHGMGARVRLHICGTRCIGGAGCEIPAATPHENVAAMVAYAHATRPDAAIPLLRGTPG